MIDTAMLKRLMTQMEYLWGKPKAATPRELLPLAQLIWRTAVDSVDEAARSAAATGTAVSQEENAPGRLSGAS